MDKSREKGVSTKLGLTPSHHSLLYYYIFFSFHSLVLPQLHPNPILFFFFFLCKLNIPLPTNHNTFLSFPSLFSFQRFRTLARLANSVPPKIEAEKGKRFDLSIEGFLGCPRMRLNGEISSGEEEEEKQTGTTTFSAQKVVVGYALTSKKKKSFLQPSFTGLARNKGINFVAVDPNKPLPEQGPFDIILHKLAAEEWREIIEDYRQKHPEVTVLDPPNAIQQLHNRQSMLQDVVDLNLSDCHGKVGVPRQLVITKENDPSSIPFEVTKAGMKLPLVAKPLVVDGTAKSHELFLAYDEFSLSELEPPLVLQEFVNHGGLLFKIYIVGETIKVVRRFSLPNISKRELSKVAGVFRFPRVSCAAASADDADLDPDIAEHPPRPLLERLARELRQRLGLRLFNIDMIREYGTKDVFYVIDINYFPGYGKMPEYEQVFTDFLLSLVQSKCKKKLTT